MVLEANASYQVNVLGQRAREVMSGMKSEVQITWAQTHPSLNRGAQAGN